MLENVSSIRHPVRAALFLDFDNIYISFSRVSHKAANLFAKEPHRWVKWFEDGQHDKGAEGMQGIPRRMLIKRCYITPSEHHYYRGFFTNAGFSVIDCPRLTSQGKNSADIYMVLDIIDTLSHRTPFDEFLILSADADFTPVVLRLREYDRRTAILTNPYAVAAYKAACDTVIEQDTFFEEALGLVQTGSVSATSGSEAIIAMAARALAEEVQQRGAIPARDLPRIFFRFPEFRGSDWFGFGSLNNLADEVCRVRPELTTVGERDVDWSFILDQDEVAAEKQQTAVSAKLMPDTETSVMRKDILGIVHEMLVNAREPIDMARAASAVIKKMGRDQVLQTNWAGEGSFKALLSHANDPEVGILNMQPGPGLRSVGNGLKLQCDFRMLRRGL